MTTQIPNQDVLIEYTSDPTGKAESFPQDLGLPHQARKEITADISDLVSRPKRGRHTYSDLAFNIPVEDTHPLDNETNTIYAYFTSMSQLQETINYAEYLNMAHKQHIINKNDEKSNDQIINLSDYIPEPKSLYQIFKLSDHIKDKWGTTIKKGIVGLFDNDTF